MNIQSQLKEYQPFLDAIKRGETVEVSLHTRWAEITNLHTLTSYPVTELRIKNPYQEFADAITNNSHIVEVSGRSFGQNWKRVWFNGRLHEWLTKNNCKELQGYLFRFAPKPDPFQTLRDAEKAGKTIQIKSAGFDTWTNLKNPQFDDKIEFYRIAPEPQKVKVAIAFRKNGEPSIYLAKNLKEEYLHFYQIEEITQKV